MLRQFYSEDKVNNTPLCWHVSSDIKQILDSYFLNQTDMQVSCIAFLFDFAFLGQ